MKMAAGAVGMVQIIRNHTEFFAFVDVASVQNAVGIHAPRIHVHKAKADMFVARVDLQRCRLLLRRADQYAIADRDNRLPIGIAALRTFVTWQTGRADILALMAETAGALSHTETAGFAKIIPPRIPSVSASQLVGHPRPVVRSAVSERLRAGERRGFFQRKSNSRISGEIGVAALFARAAVGDDIA